jgi:hypothetical protein
VAIALGLYYRVPLGPLVCPSELYDSADGTCDNFGTSNSPNTPSLVPSTPRKILLIPTVLTVPSTDSQNAGANSPPLELYDEYSGDGFLDKWDFMTFDDPTHVSKTAVG